MSDSRGPGVGVVVLLACLFGLLAGVGGAALYGRLGSAPPGSAAVVTATPSAATTGPSSVISITTDEDAIVKAAAVAGPAAVKIETVHRTQRNPFDYFMRAPAPQQVGIGSGFIFEYEEKKYVLTNTHVVAGQTGTGAPEIELSLPDGRAIKGKLVGFDRTQDIACIGLTNPPADIPTVELGDSDALRVGEWVLAIGNPLNFEHSVTVGVVSAKGPRPVAENDNRDLIQTDAAINRGNSGGPLVNLAGQVVGINTMIYSETGFSIGIGFAIPINQATELLYYLVHRGPWIGVKMYPNNAGLARYYSLPTRNGVIIVDVVRGSPSARAGLQGFDVVTHVDGQVVNSSEDMQAAIRKHSIGEATTIQIIRGKETRSVSVTTGQIPEDMYDE